MLYFQSPQISFDDDTFQPPQKPSDSSSNKMPMFSSYLQHNFKENSQPIQFVPLARNSHKKIFEPAQPVKQQNHRQLDLSNMQKATYSQNISPIKYQVPNQQIPTYVPKINQQPIRYSVSPLREQKKQQYIPFPQQQQEFAPYLDQQQNICKLPISSQLNYPEKQQQIPYQQDQYTTGQFIMQMPHQQPYYNQEVQYQPAKQRDTSPQYNYKNKISPITSKQISQSRYCVKDTLQQTEQMYQLSNSPTKIPNRSTIPIGSDKPVSDINANYNQLKEELIKSQQRLAQLNEMSIMFQNQRKKLSESSSNIKYGIQMIANQRFDNLPTLSDNIESNNYQYQSFENGDQ